MSDEQTGQRLSSMSTCWSVVCRAHTGPTDEVTRAQQQLLECYGGAVRRYLLGAVRDADLADELFQEFAVRFLRGDLRGADPERGRFRNYLKGALRHLVADHFRQRPRQPVAALAAEPAAPAAATADDDRAFLQHWRDSLLAAAWDALAKVQRQTGQLYHDVLRFRVQHPDLRSPEIAEQLSGQLRKPLTADWVRQTLHRAREQFADLLIAEVLPALAEPTAEALEEELLDLGLLEHCRPALERFRRGP